MRDRRTREKIEQAVLDLANELGLEDYKIPYEGKIANKAELVVEEKRLKALLEGPEEEEEPKKEPVYVLAKGRAITSKVGILSEGDVAKAEYGLDIPYLLERKVIVVKEDI